MVWRLGLRIIFALSLWNVQAEEPKSALCENWLTEINREFYLRSDKAFSHDDEVVRLVTEKDRLTNHRHMPVAPTLVKGRVDFERMLFFLQQGNAESIVPLIRPAAVMAQLAFKKLVRLSVEIAKLREKFKEDPTSHEALVKAELEFLTESRNFGENYGFVKNALILLESVAAGQGVPDMVGLVTHSGKKALVSHDFSGDAAVAAAKDVLSVVWRAASAADVDALRNMFASNRYALRAKLERDLRELNKIHRKVNRFAYFLAKGWAAGTQKIPEKYRHMLLRLMGMKTDSFMRDFYFGHIQELVNITRRRTADGKLIVIQDPEAIETLVRAVRERVAEFRTTNDLLITYARISFFSDSWRQLRQAVEAKKNEDPTYATLYKKIVAAEKAAVRAGEIPYVYTPDNSQEIQLVIAQLTYALATEEAVRQWLWPTIQNLLVGP